MTLKTHFDDKTRDYDGTQLCSHFAYKTFGLCGDSIVSFLGKADVKLDHMVDLEDVIQKAPIYSENMLHFIVEEFHGDLDLMICHQRLLIDNIIQEMRYDNHDLQLERRGDDIFHAEGKVSVSIATLSPVSCLIHTGININSKNTPVPTKGLEDFKLTPEAIAMGVMNRFRAELEQMKKARAKVRSVQ